MHRMNGTDSGFLSLELPSQPMHNLVLAVLSPASNPGGTPRPITLEYLHRHLAQRIDELPALRWRVQRVPFGLHHSVFIEDPEFDLRRHLTAATLPAPGDTQRLDEFCASQGETCLDRRYPLWRLTLVDGLAEGNQAVVLCIHHCLMDGAALLVNLARIFSGESHEAAVAASSWVPDPIPSRSRLLARALLDHRKTPGKAWRLVRLWRKRQPAVRLQERQSSIRVPRPRADTPQCSLNQSFSAERTYVTANLSMADIRHVKEVAGVTVNDVGLAIVGGALRAHLLERDELPSAPLVTGVLVGLENDIPRTSGNLLAGFATSLATDITDPWARLRTIHEVTAKAKRLFSALGSDIAPLALDCYPPWIAEPTIRRRNRRLLEGSALADHNLTVSNLKGPQAPWTLGFAPVEELFLAGPPNTGVGVTIAISTYGDTAHVAVLSFATALDAPVEFGHRLEASLAELVGAANASADGRVPADAPVHAEAPSTGSVEAGTEGGPVPSP